MSDLLQSLETALADRYRVEGLAGEGGMAFVYRAHDLKHDRVVAIKVLRPELAAVLGEDRFKREIHIAARLQHPNILPVYDSGSAGGHLFFVMPFVQGESLRTLLDREKQLALDDTVRIVGEVADALAYAHEHGVVHRDIKPENVLLQGGHPLIADFGVARAIEAAGGEKLTQTGMAIGTPIYMSPEQAASEPPDPRSDLYSLACVSYEMLVGVPPFTGATAGAVMARHSLEQVPSPRVVRPAIPEALEAVILRALEKIPADRYASMQQFAAAFRTAALERASGRMPSLQPRRRMPQAARWAVAGLALAAGAAGLWRLNGWSPAGARAAAPDSGAARLAVLYFATGDDSLRYVADALTESLIDRLREVPGLDVVSRDGVGGYRGQPVGRDSIGRALRAGTLVDGQVERAAGGLEVTVQLVDATSDAVFQRKGFRIAGEQVLPVLDSLAGTVTDFLRQRLGEELVLRARRGATRSGAAWAFLQRGLVSARRADSIARREGLAEAAERGFAVADSLLRLARQADPGWIEPLVRLAGLAYQRSRVVGADPVAAAPWIERSLSYADSALARDAANADAMETRGTAQYWGYLLRLYPDGAEAQARLERARADLERAVTLDPRRASAWASLSHLHYQPGMGGRTEVLIAARRAYAEDAYLANADRILSRLFLASYDNGQVVDADHWCREGGARFPDAAEFVECRLLLMTMRGAEPDVGLGWTLADSVVALSPQPERPHREARGRIVMAAVLGRAAQAARDGARSRALADSARRVLAATPIVAEIDAQGDLHMIEAFALVLLGDKDGAFRALRQWQARTGAVLDLRDINWWFQPLADDPRYSDLAGAGR